MANPAYGQATRDRMARNSRDLMDRFTSEGWRATKYASANNRAACAGITKAGDPCMAPVGYGDRKDGTGRPDGMTPDREMVFYCHRHASAVLVAERGY
jgi:hypothetical protein